MGNRFITEQLQLVFLLGLLTSWLILVQQKCTVWVTTLGEVCSPMCCSVCVNFLLIMCVYEDARAVLCKQCKGEESVSLCRTEERGRSVCWRKREWYRNIKDRGALWVSMSERGDDGVGVLKASSTAVCWSAQPPLIVQHTHSEHYSYSYVYRIHVFCIWSHPRGASEILFLSSEHITQTDAVSQRVRPHMVTSPVEMFYVSKWPPNAFTFFNCVEVLLNHSCLTAWY